MKYEVQIIKTHSKGFYLVQTKEFESEKELPEITLYNSKLRCFMIRRLLENETKTNNNRRKSNRK